MPDQAGQLSTKSTGGTPMPAQHKIDNSMKLITTTWTGEATDRELIDALLKYQHDIRSQPDYCSYDEILDFSTASSITLSSEGIRTLAHMAVSTDVQGVRTKLAIIADTTLAFGLGRMYEAYRSIVPGGVKKIRVFRTSRDALDWIENNPDH